MEKSKGRHVPRSTTTPRPGEMARSKGRTLNSCRVGALPILAASALTSQSFLASGVFGKWVHVNTVHDTAAGKVDIYLDCVKKFTMSQSAPDAADGWYNKYGVYNLGGATAQSEWRNVRFYRK